MFIIVIVAAMAAEVVKARYLLCKIKFSLCKLC